MQRCQARFDLNKSRIDGNDVIYFFPLSDSVISRTASLGKNRETFRQMSAAFVHASFSFAPVTEGECRLKSECESGQK